jgi:aminopeptidase N
MVVEVFLRSSALRSVLLRRPSSAAWAKPGAALGSVSGRVQCTLAAQPKPGEDTMTKEETVKETPKEIFLKDYKAPDYAFEKVDLKFELGEEKTLVTSKIRVIPKSSDGAPLILDGENLKLVSLKINGSPVPEDNHKIAVRKLHLTSLPTSSFDLEIVTEIEPQNNTSLEGLYKSTGNFCTQCEAEGFRKITYFQVSHGIM